MNKNKKNNRKWIIAACLIMTAGCSANANDTPETTVIPEDTASETAVPETENNVLTLSYLDAYNTMRTVTADSKETADQYRAYLSAMASFETAQPENDFSKAESITSADTKLSWIWLEEYAPAEISGTCQLVRLEQTNQETVWFAVEAESEEGQLLETLVDDIRTESFRVPEGMIALNLSGSVEPILTQDTALCEKFDQLYDSILNGSEDSGIKELEDGYDVINDGMIEIYGKTLSYMAEDDKQLSYIELHNTKTKEVRFFEIADDSSSASMLKELIDDLKNAAR